MRSLPLVFADAAYSLQKFPLSPILLLAWLPLATPSPHQMAKAGGRGDAPISPSPLSLSVITLLLALILSHIASFF